MSGERNLNTLLKHASPKLNPGLYVYSTLENVPTELYTLAVVIVKEHESTTLVLPKQVAEQFNIAYDYVAGWITLEVHSSLAAVGLTAAFSAALAKHNISCNVVAGFYHDHIFVAYDETEKAVNILSALSQP